MLRSTFIAIALLMTVPAVSSAAPTHIAAPALSRNAIAFQPLLDRQQLRIAAGWHDGRLTRAEYRRLSREQTRIQRYLNQAARRFKTPRTQMRRLQTMINRHAATITRYNNNRQVAFKRAPVFRRGGPVVVNTLPKLPRGPRAGGPDYGTTLPKAGKFKAGKAKAGKSKVVKTKTVITKSGKGKSKMVKTTTVKTKTGKGKTGKGKTGKGKTGKGKTVKTKTTKTQTGKSGKGFGKNKPGKGAHK